MPDVINVGKNAMDVHKSVLVMPYNKVVINVEKQGDSVISFEASAEQEIPNGITLEIDCPWGTQLMADDMLAKVKGYQYQPYEVTTAIVDPATEMGDAIQTNGVYGGIYAQDSIFSHTFYSDFSAPQDEQIDHEFTFKSPVERRLARQEAYANATFQIQHDNIEAKVSQRGGDKEAQTFSWRLLSDEFGLYSGTKKVFMCDKSGITVDGTIKARSGYIGTDSNGFVISDKSIYNTKTGIGNKSTEQTNGVYVGTNGIALGRVSYTVDNVTTYYDAFSVTNNGVFTARNGYIGNGSNGFHISAKSIYNGTNSISSTTVGSYVGIDGIRGYYDATHNYTFAKSTSTFKIMAGKSTYNDTNTGVYIGTDGIGLGSGKFYVTNSGILTAKDVTLTGTITTKSGRIGADSDGENGFYIGNKNVTIRGQSRSCGYMYTWEHSSRDDTDNYGVYIGADGISLGKATDADEDHPAFRVDYDGELFASNAHLSGEISAMSGRIGCTSDGKNGLIIKNKRVKVDTDTYEDSCVLYTGNHDSRDNKISNGVYIGADGISLGKATSTDPNHPAFRVDYDGELFASNVHVSGSITTGSGSSINGGYIDDGTVDTDQLSGSSVTTSKIKDKAVTKDKGSTSVQNSLDNGDAAKDKIDDLCAGRITADYLYASTIRCSTFNVEKSDSVYLRASWQSYQIDDDTTLNYLGR